MILYNRAHQLLLYNPTVKRKLKFSLLRGSLRSWVHIFIKENSVVLSSYALSRAFTLLPIEEGKKGTFSLLSSDPSLFLAMGRGNAHLTNMNLVSTEAFLGDLVVFSLVVFTRVIC